MRIKGKAIINGLRYDTEAPQTREIGTANNLAEASSITDFRYWEATLYRTGGGRFFLMGEGGPMTRFARPSGGGLTGGEKVVPLGEEEAQEWAEAFLPAEIVEVEFRVEEA